MLPKLEYQITMDNLPHTFHAAAIEGASKDSKKTTAFFGFYQEKALDILHSLSESE